MPPPQLHVESLPTTSLVGITQTAVGCGVGLLMADRLGSRTRTTIAIALFSLGFISSMPLVFSVIARCWNSPGTKRGMQQRLESIRGDSGFPQEYDAF